MKVTASKNVVARGDILTAGETYELPDDLGKELIDGGHASAASEEAATEDTAKASKKSK